MTAFATTVIITTALLAAVDLPRAVATTGVPVAPCATVNAGDAIHVLDNCEPTAPIPVNSRVVVPNPNGRAFVGVQIGRQTFTPSNGYSSGVDDCMLHAQLVAIDRQTAEVKFQHDWALCADVDLEAAAYNIRHVGDDDASDPLHAPIEFVNTYGVPEARNTASLSQAKIDLFLEALKTIGVAGSWRDIFGYGLSAIGHAAITKVGGAHVCRQTENEPASVTALAAAQCNQAGYLESVLSPNPRDSDRMWTFNRPAFGSFDVHASGSTPTTNTISVAHVDPSEPSRQITTPYSATYSTTTNSTGWFHILELDARTLTVLNQQAYGVRAADTDTERGRLTTLAGILAGLRTAAHPDALLFVVSVGSPMSHVPTDTAPNVGQTLPTHVSMRNTYWDAALSVANEVRLLGGVPESFLKLPTDGNYSLVTSLAAKDGRITGSDVVTANYGQVMELSAARPPHFKDGEMVGQLTLGNSSTWVPTGITNTTGDLGAMRYLAPPKLGQRYLYQNYAVPQARAGETCVVPEDTSGCIPGQLKAFNWWAQALRSGPSGFAYDADCAQRCGLSLRDDYRNTNAGNLPAQYSASLGCGTACPAQMADGCATSLPNYPYPGFGAGFTCADYTFVRDSLLPELRRQGQAWEVYHKAREQWTKQATDFKLAASEVWRSIQASLNEATELKRWQDERQTSLTEMITEIVVGVGAFLILGSETVGVFLSHAAEAIRDVVRQASVKKAGDTALFGGSIGATLWFSGSDVFFGVMLSKFHVGESTWALTDVGTNLGDLLARQFDNSNGIGNSFALLLSNYAGVSDLAANVSDNLPADSPYYVDTIADDTEFATGFRTGLRASLYRALLPNVFNKLEVTNAPSYYAGDLSTHFACTSVSPLINGEIDGSGASACWPNDNDYNVRKNFTPEPWGQTVAPWSSTPPEIDKRFYSFPDTRAASSVPGSDRLFTDRSAGFGYTNHTLPHAVWPSDLRLLWVNEAQNEHNGLDKPYPISMSLTETIFDDGVWPADFWRTWEFPTYRIDANNDQDGDGWRHYWNARPVTD